MLIVLRTVISVAGHTVAVQPSTDEGCADSFLDITNSRANLLENLLILLNSATDLGVGPSIADLAPRQREGVGVVNSARAPESRLHGLENIFIHVL